MNVNRTLIAVFLCFAALVTMAHAAPEAQSAPSPHTGTNAATSNIQNSDTSGKTPARLISGHDPDYSDEAYKARVEGTVILALEVNQKGKVTAVRVVNSLDPSLDRKAVKAVKKWKFAPAMLDGKAVPSEFNVSVDFRLNR